MGHAHERKQVVLADRTEGDVPQQNRLGVVTFERDSFAELLRRILVEAGEELLVGVGNAGRGRDQTWTQRILADGGEDLSDGGLDARTIDSGHAPTSPSLRRGRPRLANR